MKDDETEDFYLCGRCGAFDGWGGHGDLGEDGMKMKYIRRICGAVGFVSFLFALGTVGAAEVGNVTMGQALVRIVPAIVLMGGAVGVCERLRIW